ncbi:MAG: ABC transporter substrate-binding protein [Crocinitomicaceae bacterium]|nr:ABC transporter substrate-binding protein [Crocinitomicaceae bacterium]
MKTIFSFYCLLFATIISAADPLKIWITSYQDKKYYEAMVKEYQKLDASFEASIEAYGFMEMPDKLNIAMKTGQGSPDIVQLDEVLFSVFLRGETPFVDLAEHVNKDAKLSGGFHPQRLALFKQGEKILALPQSLSAYVLYYRRDLFNKYHIRKEEVATWEGLYEVGMRLQKDYQQRFMPLDPSYFEVLLRQRGFQMFDNKGQAFPDMSIAIDTMEFLIDLNDNKIAQLPDRGTIFDPVFFNGDVMNNEVVAVLGADWYGLDMMQNFCPDLDGSWGILPMPRWNKDEFPTSRKSSTFAGQGLSIMKSSQQQDRAWKFLKWVMSSKNGNIERYTQGNSFSAYMPSWIYPEMTEGSSYFGGDSMGKILIDSSTDLPPIAMNPKRGICVFLLREKYFASIIMGNVNPKTALDKLREALNQAPKF